MISSKSAKSFASDRSRTIFFSYDATSQNDITKVKSLQRNLLKNEYYILEHSGFSFSTTRKADVDDSIKNDLQNSIVCVFCVSRDFQRNLSCRSLLNHAIYERKRYDERNFDIILAFLHGDYSPLCDEFLNERGGIARYIKEGDIAWSPCWNSTHITNTAISIVSLCHSLRKSPLSPSPMSPGTRKPNHKHNVIDHILNHVIRSLEIIDYLIDQSQYFKNDDRNSEILRMINRIIKLQPFLQSLLNDNNAKDDNDARQLKSKKLRLKGCHDMLHDAKHFIDQHSNDNDNDINQDNNANVLDKILDPQFQRSFLESYLRLRIRIEQSLADLLLVNTKPSSELDTDVEYNRTEDISVHVNQFSANVKYIVLSLSNGRGNSTAIVDAIQREVSVFVDRVNYICKRLGYRKLSTFECAGVEQQLNILRNMVEKSNVHVMIHCSPESVGPELDPAAVESNPREKEDLSDNDIDDVIPIFDMLSQEEELLEDAHAVAIETSQLVIPLAADVAVFSNDNREITVVEIYNDDPHDENAALLSDAIIPLPKESALPSLETSNNPTAALLPVIDKHDHNNISLSLPSDPGIHFQQKKRNEERILLPIAKIVNTDINVNDLQNKLIPDKTVIKTSDKNILKSLKYSPFNINLFANTSKIVPINSNDFTSELEIIKLYHSSRNGNIIDNNILLSLASEEGNYLSQGVLCILHTFGEGVSALDVILADKYACTSVQYVTQYASLGNPFARMLLGFFYEMGLGLLVSNKQEAVRCYHSAADVSVDAKTHLGRCYMTGEGLGINVHEAMRWFRLAADEGDAKAQVELGKCYNVITTINKIKSRKEIRENQEDALKWFKLSADQNFAEGLFQFGSVFQHGMGKVIPNDSIPDAISYYLRAAEQGHEGSLIALDNIFESSRCALGKTRDETVRFYRVVAERGNAEAQFKMGAICEKGTSGGVEKDILQAIYWYKQCKGGGKTSVQYKIGSWFEQGITDVMSVDLKEAVWWYRLCDAGRHAEMQYRIASWYEHGQSDELTVVIERNIDEAIYWYKLCKAGNDMQTQLRIAGWYESGLEVSNGRDVIEAVYWYTLCFAIVPPEIQFKIAGFYEFGSDGLDRDLVKAVWWYELCKGGNISSVQNKIGSWFEGIGLLSDNDEEKENNSPSGLLVDRDKAAWWYKLCNANNDKAVQMIIANWYEHGDGVSQSFCEAVYWYKLSDDVSNFPDLQFKIGQWIENGFCGEVYTLDDAIYWHKLSAASGFPAAQYNLGRISEQKGEFGECISFYVASAPKSAESRDALCRLFNMEIIDSPEVSPNDRVQWCRIVAKTTGDTDAQNLMAAFYETGNGVTKSLHNAARWYLRAAEKRKPIAQFKIGSWFENGVVVSQDFAEAVKWYKLCNANGNKSVKLRVANWFETGYANIPKSVADAVFWYTSIYELENSLTDFPSVSCNNFENENNNKSVAENKRNFEFENIVQNDLEIQLKVGSWFENGNENLSPDLSKALLWYNKCNGNGDVETQLRVAGIYEERGNFQEAVRWYSMCCITDTASSADISFKDDNNVRIKISEVQLKIGMWFELGKSEDKEIDNNVNQGNSVNNIVTDISNAIYWYSLAASRGNARAQYLLGFIYLDGRHCDQQNSSSLNIKLPCINSDLKKAKHFIQLASEKKTCTTGIDAHSQINFEIANKYFQRGEHARQKAINHLTIASIADHTEAQVQLAELLLLSELSQQTPSTKLAREMEYELWGMGQMSRRKEALYWLRRAAAKSTKASRFLAVAYRDGSEGVFRNKWLAMHYFQRAGDIAEVRKLENVSCLQYLYEDFGCCFTMSLMSCIIDNASCLPCACNNNYEGSSSAGQYNNSYRAFKKRKDSRNIGHSNGIKDLAVAASCCCLCTVPAYATVMVSSVVDVVKYPLCCMFEIPKEIACTGILCLKETYKSQSPPVECCCCCYCCDSNYTELSTCFRYLKQSSWNKLNGNTASITSGDIK